MWAVFTCVVGSAVRQLGGPSPEPAERGLHLRQRLHDPKSGASCHDMIADRGEEHEYEPDDLL
jgi:hypothetical protein